MLIYLQMIETEEEKSKFEQLYMEYRNLLMHLAYKRLGNTQDAEDAVHKVYVRIAEKIKIIEPVCPKTKKLVVIMIENTVTDMLRERGKHPAVSLIEEPMTEEQLPTGENLLEDCILRLPEKQRAVIWLKYHHGYSLREIAGLLGITLAWAQKLDQRAKNKLEELYLERGGIL